MTVSTFIAAAGLGLAAGLLGGLAGVGGSMILLPGLHWLKVAGTGIETHHLYMAVAMTVNVAVALPAAMKHKLAGAVRQDLLPTLLVWTTLGIIVGVLLSNQFTGNWLRIALGFFVAAYCVYNLVKLAKGESDPALAGRVRGRPEYVKLGLSGLATGLVGGLLGLGGGVLLVPLLQVVCRVPLRQSIATSSSVIWMTAMVGAGLKLLTLSSRGLSAWQALGIAAALIPTAIVGGWLGAKLTHALPLAMVRGLISAILAIAAAKLLGAF